MFSKLLPSTAALLSLVTLAVAHMEMIQPPPRNSKYNPTFQGIPDYDMVNPLGIYPCKGYEQGKVVQTVQAGSKLDIKLSGVAVHDGGHCQFAISYDGGKNFAVLDTIYNDCIIASLDYSVTIPSTAGSSKNVIFAWAWINKVGNREYYMNCADIEIKGSDDGYITGPELLVANLPGYPQIPEFPYDGPNDGRDLLAARPTITIRPEKDTSTPEAGICDDVSAWDTKTAYFESQTVTHEGHLWQAKWWTQGDTPGSSGTWIDLGAC
ncbi:hypothetical protein K7432_006100 [Basidiobolus ranarum]|uniref:Chitin-binding type-3 domain-containing protein n=1 Tax=Basidiobolus ranarum TaxID=34480 RepID=A0ABR2WVL3_9FUNG